MVCTEQGQDVGSVDVAVIAGVVSGVVVQRVARRKRVAAGVAMKTRFETTDATCMFEGMTIDFKR